MPRLQQYGQGVPTEAIIVLACFGPTVHEVIERTPVKHILLASLGDVFGAIKGPRVTYKSRNVDKRIETLKKFRSLSFRRSTRCTTHWWSSPISRAGRLAPMATRRP